MDTLSGWILQTIKILAHFAMYNFIQLEVHRIMYPFQQQSMMIKPRPVHYRLLKPPTAPPMNANSHSVLHIISNNA